MNFYDNAVIAMEKLHMQWNVIMDLYFYDFQNILQRYSKILDDRKKDEDEEMKKQGYDESKYTPDNMMNKVQKSMPKIPNITIPKL